MDSRQTPAGAKLRRNALGGRRGILGNLTRIGFVGLGAMGSKMASNLLKGGYELTVYNRSLSAVQKLVREGAVAASSPAQIAETCEVVILSLPSTGAVKETVMGEKGLMRGLRPGSIVVDTSTIDPQTSRDIADEMTKRGLYFLDAPVSGGPEGAAAGTLAVMVGGDRVAFARCEEVFRTMGKNVFYLGESGSGLRVKLFNQALVGAYFVAIAEAYIWSSKMNVKLEDLEKVITKSWGDSGVFRHFLLVIGSGNFKEGATFKNLTKDLSIILESAAKEGVSLSLLELANQYMSGASQLGFADLDASSLYQFLDKLKKPR
jgi:3-hydroxyisobutyrate dehydrogenase-like beta-hydroxyacid dehydrogenase